MTIQEVADALRVSNLTIRRRIKDGSLKATLIKGMGRGKWEIKEEDFKRYIKSNERTENV